MATWYVDFAAGTGNGSATNTPAGTLNAVNGSSNVAAGDTCLLYTSPSPRDS